MNVMKVIGMAVLMTVSFAGCEKDKAATPVTPEIPAIHGKWVSKILIGSGPDAEYETLYFSVKDKGLFEALDVDNPNIVALTGEWKLTNNTAFEATIPDEEDPSVKVTLSATFDSKSGTLMTGIAKSGNFQIGTWQAYKW